MPDDSSQSEIEINIGTDNIRLKGTESFISDQLNTILDRVDLGAQKQAMDGSEEGQKSKQATLEDVSEGGTSTPDNLGGISSSPNVSHKISNIAERINVKPESLAEHFYIDGEDIHIQNPLKIDPKYALLGYCTIKEELAGEPYHDNTSTKKKLIDIEKVDVGDWGGTLLHNLRRSGLIKDDPNSQKDRNRPFKITPQGRAELVKWLDEDD